VRDFIMNVFVRAQDAIVVLDNLNKEYAKKYFGRDAIIVRSGLDQEQFSYSGKRADDKLNILLTGILLPHRRAEDAIEAVKLLHDRGIDANLNIIGRTDMDPHYSEKLMGLVRLRGLADRIKFFGKVTEEDLVKAYRINDAFVFPNYLQTWGLAVFEAMASGMPVIVSKGCGASEVLTDNENALLVEPKQPEQIAWALARLHNERELKPKLSRNGREFVENNISWRKYAENMLEVYEL
jgi:glycosyltransferase involved in cell wall biosynthesis